MREGRKTTNLLVGLSQPCFLWGSRVKFLGQGGLKVKGVVTAHDGRRRTVTWQFAGPCKFINVSIEGYGSLVAAVGKVHEFHV
jgi:hypothetical protein